MFFSREGRDLGVAFQDPPGCQALSRGEAKDSAVLPSRDADIVEPPSGVSGVKPPLHFGERARDCSPGHAGKEVPSHRKDGGVSGVSSSCGALGGFLARHGEDLREPLVWRQGSQFSLRVARGSALWLSSNGRGLGPQDALKRDSRGPSRAAAGKPHFPRLLPGTLGNFPGGL